MNPVEQKIFEIIQDIECAEKCSLYDTCDGMKGSPGIECYSQHKRQAAAIYEQIVHKTVSAVITDAKYGVRCWGNDCHGNLAGTEDCVDCWIKWVNEESVP